MAYFTRQEQLKGFHQDLLSGETVLVLGVGGIGSNIAIGLCRMGVKRILLVDKDVVEDHNLNRQQLYAIPDIGQNKVEAAKKRLDEQHNLCTQVDAFHMDALVHWDTVVQLARGSTCVFNTIDHGDKWDYAVGALCHELQICVFLGGTEPWYGHLLSTFAQVPNGPCYACAHDLPAAPLDPKKVMTYTDISFLPPDPQPEIGGSTTYSASMCSQVMLSQYGTYRMQQEGWVLKHTVIVRLINLEMDTFVCEKNDRCTICAPGGK